MCPGIRPATGWMANFTSTPRAPSVSASSRTLCWAWATAIPYPGAMITSRALRRISAASSGAAERTSPSSEASPASAVWSFPNAPNRTLRNDRFMARHMITESRNPEEPSRAPAMIRILEFSTNPMAAADSPA